MKILFIAPLPPPQTGQAIASEKLLSSLLSTPSVEVITMNYAKKNFKHGVNSISRIIEMIQFILQVYRQKKHCTDVYFTITQSIPGNIRDLILLFLLRKKNISIHLHGGGIAKTVFEKNKLLKYLNIRAYKNVKNIIILGESLKSCFDGMAKEDQLKVVPNFAENYFFASDKDFQQKYQQEKYSILYLSNLINGKGYKELAMAIKKMPTHYKEKLKVTFVGGFDYDENKKEFENIIRDETCIEYLGVIKGENRKELFLSHDFFCLPTYYPYEGQPISILEAYAMGCNVITTYHNGIVDIFQEGINGYKVEKKNVENLSKSLIKIIDTPNHSHKKIGLHNLSEASTKYTVQQYLDTLQHIILEKDGTSFV